MIADDSAFMRKKIKEILQSDPDIRVVVAARDGQEAVAYVKEHEPDVVTMDINMPVMDGITALQIIMADVAPAGTDAEFAHPGRSDCDLRVHGVGCVRLRRQAHPAPFRPI